MHALKSDVKQRFRTAQDQLRDPLLTALTILLLILIFLIVPFHAAGVISAQGYGFVLAMLLASCVLIQSKRPIAIVVMLLGVGLVAASVVVRFKQIPILGLYLEASAWITIGLALASVVAGAVFAPRRVTYHRINGAVLLYVTISLIFVALFTFVGILVPDAFSGLSIRDGPELASNVIYFSFTTLTTTGYGDMVPRHPVARSLCNVESIIGELYPATLLARLVTLELEDRRK